MVPERKGWGGGGSNYTSIWGAFTFCNYNFKISLVNDLHVSVTNPNWHTDSPWACLPPLRQRLGEAEVPREMGGGKPGQHLRGGPQVGGGQREN